MVAACSIALFLLVVLRMAGLVLRQQRATTREQKLRSAVAVLAAASDHERVCNAAVEAAVALVGETGDVRASLLLGSGAERVVFATAGTTVAEALQATFPLTLKEQSLGELVLESDAPLPRELDEALRSLAGQVVLALGVDRTDGDARRGAEGARDGARPPGERGPVTGLANRTLFPSASSYALRRRDAPRPVSVLFVDLDDFKTVNDASATPPATSCCVGVAAPARSCLRARRHVARLGGDEFGVLLEGRTAPPSARERERVLASASLEPFELAGQRGLRSASIGIAHRARRRPQRRRAAAQRRRRDVPRRQRGKGGFASSSRMHDAVASASRSRRTSSARSTTQSSSSTTSRSSTCATGRDRRRRGAGPLAAPEARARAAGRLHPARRGDRADRPDRPLGAGEACRQAARLA